MSILQVKGRTTCSQDDFEKYALSSNSYIFTTAEEHEVEEYSIELKLGHGWNENYSDFDKNLQEIKDCINLRGRASIVVEVLDEIRVPHNKYGIVLPTGSQFLSRGILIASAKVEPSFHGRLKLRLFNTTNQKISINKGEKLGSVIFFSTESTKVHDKIVRTSEISSSKISQWSQLKKWLSTNKNLWIGWVVTVITSSLLAFLLTYLLYYKPMLALQARLDQGLESDIQVQTERTDP